MCGIVGAAAERDVVPILVEGLRRLEYRGYDSAGIAAMDKNEIKRVRAVGKVNQLVDALKAQPLKSTLGIAHTRWATHGVPSQNNAHPHQSGSDLALVHNGIIENHLELRETLQGTGYEFNTETDTEVVAHLLHQTLANTDSTIDAICQVAKQLKGAYALVIMLKKEPEKLYALRSGCPLVIGLGIGENYFASDSLALLPVTRRFIYLHDNDVAEISRDSYHIFNEEGQPIQRPEKELDVALDQADKGNFRHFMQKEIFEQVEAITATLEGRVSKQHVLAECFGTKANELLQKVEKVQIVACGTSYHAGLVAKYWLESLAGIHCQIEVASEYRYRDKVVLPNTLFVVISQSGETADSLAALKQAKTLGYLASLAICNVPESSIVRESDLVFMTRAGVEIGVASTKAFTTQLVALLLLTIALARIHVPKFNEEEMVNHLNNLPALINQALALDHNIKALAKLFAEKNHALYLGRGSEYPIALEGALKLKEISYIHAEAYPAGELKHGPLALVDKHMPVIAVAPNDAWLDKLKSNLHEVQARGGQLIVFADKAAHLHDDQHGTHVFEMPEVCSVLAPIVYSIPLQLLAYHVAVLKGTDVDQPRNLAKSVTVE